MPKKSKLKKPSLKDEVEVEVQQLEVDSPGEEVQEVVEDQNLTDENKDKDKGLAGVSFNDEYDELLSLKEKELQIRSDKSSFIKEHQKLFDLKMKEFSSLVKKNIKEQDLIVKKLKKIHNSEIKKATKRKRTGKNKGGFNSETLVPKKLRDFLGLEDDATLSRPTVFHLMSEKYKQEGLKDGQEVILDKKNAKKLGMPNGYKIPFSGQQPFIAQFYKEEKEKSVTV